jgi:hypothetical protein
MEFLEIMEFKWNFWYLMEFFEIENNGISVEFLEILEFLVEFLEMNWKFWK